MALFDMLSSATLNMAFNAIGFSTRTMNSA